MSELIIEVCKVDKVEKHPNADLLDILTIKGWNCIVGLNQFKEGDLVVYCPPDSVIPNDLIEKYDLEYLKKCGRVGTIKLRKFISQGLVLNIPEGVNWKEGKDVAYKLGITKYEPPLPSYQRFQEKDTILKMLGKYRQGKISFRRFLFKSFGIIKDKFTRRRNINPFFSKYIHIENIKNYNKVFKEGETVVITEKIHGTNFRAGWVPRKKNRWMHMRKHQEFCYGSHRVQLTGRRGKQCWYGEDVYGAIAERYKLAEIIPEDYIIYGEIYGKGIQELEYDLENTELAVFDVKHWGKYLANGDLIKFCEERNLPMVPLLGIEEFNENTVSTYTQGQSIIAKHMREGCVIKPLGEESHSMVGRKILKSINPEYLVTKDRTDFH